MSRNSGSSAGGIDVLGLLGVVFVTLKLCGVIDWSWWLVLAPFWSVPAILFLVAGVALTIGIANLVARKIASRMR